MTGNLLRGIIFTLALAILALSIMAKLAKDPPLTMTSDVPIEMPMSNMCLAREVPGTGTTERTKLLVAIGEIGFWIESDLWWRVQTTCAGFGKTKVSA